MPRVPNPLVAAVVLLAPRGHDGGYAVPEGEAGAGEFLVVTLLGEVSPRVAEPGTTALIWTRCQLTS